MNIYTVEIQKKDTFVITSITIEAETAHAAFAVAKERYPGCHVVCIKLL